ncbi:MAG: putative nucleic acid-binding protein [Akkermansiaceae bacterium]|jgi:predicted nucleic acid-binding protein
MTGYLLDTNVVSELRKGSRCHPKVTTWHQSLSPNSTWLSVLVLAEIRCGIENLRRRDPITSAHLERWLEGLTLGFQDRILPISPAIANRWGILNSGDPIPYIDGFLAATALESGLTLVTRNVKDISTTGVSFLNPFE